jgi:hypothetical protein
MLITLDEYTEKFHWKYRFYFRDCAIRNKNIFVFVTEPELTDEQVQEEEKNNWSPDLRPKGIRVFIKNNPPGKMWSGQYLQGWENIVIGTAKLPLDQAIYIESTAVYPSLDVRVFMTGSGPAYEDTPLKPWLKPNDRTDFRRGHIGKIKPIEGYAYACGGGRSFGRRISKSKWESFSHYFPKRKETESHAGFEDFDAWSASDIYLAGGEGDVWHFEAKKGEARKLAFPSNMPLYAVCCGGDGNVYISDVYGTIWVGGGDSWKKLRGVSLSLPPRDMVWYENRVWATNDYGLYWINKGKLEFADVPPEISVCSGNLSVGDGVMLLAGYGGAAFKEDGKWEQILLFDTMEKLVALQKADKQGR